MEQPLVTITNFLLSAACLLMSWKMWAAPAEHSDLKRSFSIVFFASGVAAFLGGLVHGYYEGTEQGNALWVMTLLSIGMASYHLWIVTGLLIFNDRMMRYLRWFVRILFVVLLVVLVTVTQKFWLAIITYVPPVLNLIAIVSLRYMREKNKFYLFGVLGLAMTLFAAYIQVSHIGIAAWGIDHNSLYHILQGLALWGVYLFGSRVSRWNM